MQVENTTRATTPRQVPVTTRALVQRLKRRHARDGESFHVTRVRDPRAYNADLGCCYVVESNYVRNSWQTLADLIEHARELGVLHAHEAVVA